MVLFEIVSTNPLGGCCGDVLSASCDTNTGQAENFDAAVLGRASTARAWDTACRASLAGIRLKPPLFNMACSFGLRANTPDLRGPQHTDTAGKCKTRDAYAASWSMK